MVLQQRSSSSIKALWTADSRQILLGSQLGFLQVFDAQTLKLVRAIALPGPYDEPLLLTYEKVGERIAVSHWNKPLAIYNLGTEQLEKELGEVTAYASGLAFSADGRILAAWCHDSSVYLWRVETGQKLARIHEYSMRMIEPVFPEFHPILPTLVTFCDKRRSLRIWDLDDKELLG
jgi:WD40 repeat protein